MINKLLKFLIISVLFVSCASREEIVYFQGSAKVGKTLDFKNKVLILQPQDRLSINVSAQEQAAVIPFNLPLINSVLNSDLSTSTAGAVSTQNYVVNSDGNIDFPVLGEIKVSGLSIESLKSKLTTEISKYVKRPIVTIEIKNFKISVLGEVNRPGTFTIEDHSINLSKALGTAGDLTIYGKRDNVLVMREEADGRITRNYIDITDPNIVTSPYYYLKQNDIVYVEPNKSQMQSSKYRNASVYASIAIALGTVASLIIPFIPGVLVDQ